MNLLNKKKTFLLFLEWLLSDLFVLYFTNFMINRVPVIALRNSIVGMQRIPTNTILPNTNNLDSFCVWVSDDVCVENLSDTST